MRILTIAGALALVAVLAMPMAAMAAENDSTEVSGDISVELELTAPGDIDLGTMTIAGANAADATAGSVKCNSSLGYTVTVKSDKTDGIMASGSYALANALQVTTGSFGPGAVTTTDPTAAIVDTSAPGITAINLHVSQAIVYADAAANNYGLTLTYTATAK